MPKMIVKAAGKILAPDGRYREIGEQYECGREADISVRLGFADYADKAMTAKEDKPASPRSTVTRARYSHRSMRAADE